MSSRHPMRLGRRPMPLATLLVAALAAMSATATAWLPGASAAPPSGRIVLAFGSNEGLDHERPLLHAESDAEKFAEVFRTIGGAAPADVRVVTGASAARVLSELTWGVQRVQERGSNASLVVYFSGHGDAQAVHSVGDSISLDTLRQTIQIVPAHLKLVVVDACRSTDGRQRGFREAEPFTISLEAPPGPAGAVLLRSASEGEAAQESDELGGGVFTHYFVSGLRGAADDNSDGRVSLDEAYSFAYERTLARSARSAGALQRPSADLSLSGSGPLVLTQPDRARAKLVLPADSDTQFLIFRLPSETLEAEVWGRSSSTTEVAVPTGRYVVHRRSGDRVSRTELSLPYGGSHQLKTSDFRDEAPLRVAARGGADLVRHNELSAAYAAGYGLSAGLGHRVRIGHGWRFTSRWMLDVRAELGLSRWSTTDTNVEQKWVGGSVAATFRQSLGPTELRVSLGPALYSVWQDWERHDAARLESGGYPGHHSDRGLALGPSLELQSAIPLSGRWWLRPAVTAQWWLYDEGGSLGDRLWLAAELAAVIEF